MAEPIRLFILAGEPSGDRIGADLVKRLRVQHRVTLTGVGGAELEGEGLKSLYPMSDLSVMGLTDVIKRLPLLLWRARQTSQAILALSPDMVVLIDSQVFSQTVAGQLRKAGYAGKIVLYVAPSVWAWKPERAPALKPLYDEVLAVLPFEP
ncbi:MAG: lipid-A-disaccharide synthase, partial [Devosia sp.]|nr:lipid-A-disaccharide synthase [Devosia sp.]